MKKKWVAAVGAVLLVMALGLAGVGRAAGDPVPKLNPNITYDVAPGPGWPAGWQPPAAPTKIPQDEIDAWEWEKTVPGMVAPKRLELLVLPFLPPWTKEYPYFWGREPFMCGETRYIYFHPLPDSVLMRKTYGDGYNYSGGPLGGPDCLYSPVTKISSAMTSPEQKHREEMGVHLRQDLDYARMGNMYQGGLQPCAADRLEGTLENIFVCINGGDGSQRFDVPAYLDLEAKRVRVPVRFVSEMMRAEVSWEDATQTVTIHFPPINREIAWPVSEPGYKPSDWIDPDTPDYRPDRYHLELKTVTQPVRSIKLTVGKPVALVDGKEIAIDAPPVLLPPGRVMVPVRFVSEVMGAKVYWVGKDPIWKDYDRPGSTVLKGRYQVHIYTPFYPFFDYPDWYLETRAQRT